MRCIIAAHDERRPALIATTAPPVATDGMVSSKRCPAVSDDGEILLEVVLQYSWRMLHPARAPSPGSRLRIGPEAGAFFARAATAASPVARANAMCVVNSGGLGAPANPPPASA